MAKPILGMKIKIVFVRHAKGMFKNVIYLFLVLVETDLMKLARIRLPTRKLRIWSQLLSLKKSTLLVYDVEHQPHALVLPRWFMAPFAFDATSPTLRWGHTPISVHPGIVANAASAMLSFLPRNGLSEKIQTTSLSLSMCVSLVSS
jgi:hypothetical protein